MHKRNFFFKWEEPQLDFFFCVYAAFMVEKCGERHNTNPLGGFVKIQTIKIFNYQIKIWLGKQKLCGMHNKYMNRKRKGKNRIILAIIGHEKARDIFQSTNKWYTLAANANKIKSWLISVRWVFFSLKYKERNTENHFWKGVGKF